MINLLELEPIHTTDRSTFKNCRQKWDMSSNLRMNLEPEHPYEPFFFGTAIHDALALYYDPSTPRDIVSAFEQAFAPAIKEWFDELTEGQETPSEEQWNKKEELEDLGSGMLDQYDTYAKREDDFEVIWTERAEQIVGIHLPYEFDPQTIPYSFRCDGLVRDKRGLYWILEHKTTASFPGTVDYLMHDDQVSTYIWALQIALGIKIEGVIYNFIRKKIAQPLKLLKPTKNEPIKFSVDQAQDTTHELAKKALFEYWPKGQGLPLKYREFLDFLYHKPDNFIHRETIKRNRKEVANTGAMLPYELFDMLDDPHIYRTPTKMNCNGCIFFDPCLLKWESGNWEELLKTNYKQREQR